MRRRSRPARAAAHQGWLPYTLTWESEIVESRYPYGFTLVASGDFDGRGVWTFEQDGAFVDITYDWRLSAEKPLLRNLSFLLKPLFEAQPPVGDGAGRTESDSSSSPGAGRRRTPCTFDDPTAARSRHMRGCSPRRRRGCCRRRSRVSDGALARKTPLKRRRPEADGHNLFGDSRPAEVQAFRPAIYADLKVPHSPAIRN